MSLQVWLPLTKDLKNQGLNNITINNEGASFENSGKLGGCYNLTSGPIALSNLPNPSEISVAFWFKRTANTNSIQFLFTAWNGVTCELTSNGEPLFAIYRNNYTNIKGNAITTASGWTHYCGTFNTTEGMKLYINGILIASDNLTTPISWNTTIGRLGKFQSYASASVLMNDFRIYDHCLSPMEVKEIAKGLVLHYPLSDGLVEKSQNLCTTLTDGTGTQTWGDHSTVWTIEDATDFPIPVDKCMKAVHTYTYSGTWGGYSRSIQTISASPSTVYTYSCYMKVSDNFEYTTANFIYRYEYTSSGSYVTEGGLFDETRMKAVGNGWYRCWGTFTTQATTGQINISFFSYAEKNTTHWVGGWQIEQKDHMTSFMAPGTSRNSNIIYDCSGFNNNGIIYDTTIQIVPDSVKYAASLKNSQAYNSYWYPFKGFLALSDIDRMTVAFWAKPTSIGHQDSGIFSTTANDIPTDYQATAMNHYDGVIACTNTSGKVANLGVSNQFTLNEWHHYCIVYDGTKIWFYKDGTTYISVAQTGKLKPFTTIFPFYSCAGGANRTTSGYLNDLRIYTTALSASDIKSLYQNAAYIDNDGNVYGAVHSEV